MPKSQSCQNYSTHVNLLLLEIMFHSTDRDEPELTVKLIERTPLSRKSFELKVNFLGETYYKFKEKSLDKLLHI